MTDDEELAVLRRGLDQLAGLVADVRPEAADDLTPGTDWTAPTPPAGDYPGGGDAYGRIAVFAGRRV